MLALIGCGLINDDPVQNSDIYQNSELSGSCSIDPEAFSKFLEEDVQTQIVCLEKNFEQFNRYVKKDNPQVIGKKELSVFVEDFFPTQVSSIMDGLELLFKVNLIFIDDNHDQISNDGLRKLFKLLVQANKNIVSINKAFIEYEEQKISLSDLRSEFTNSLSRLAQAAIESIPEHKSTDISIEGTIRDVTKRFKSLKITNEQIRLIKIIKKLVIGSDSNSLNCDELRLMLQKVSEISPIIFDLLYTDHYNLVTKEDYYSFTLERIELIFKSLNLDQDGVVLSHDDVGFLTKYLDLNIDHELLKKTSLSAKINLFTPEESDKGFNTSDLKLLKVYAHAYLKSFLTWNEINFESANKLSQPRSFYAEMLNLWAIEINKLVDTTILPEELKIKPFVDDIKVIWDITKKDIQLLESIMLIKPLLVGGKPISITPLEIARLLPKLKDVALLAFDAKIFAREKKSNSEWLDFSLATLNAIDKNIYRGDDFEVAFMTSGLESIKVYFDDKYLKFVNGALGGFPAIKKRLFGGHEEVVLFKEFRLILSEIKNVVETLYLTDITADLYTSEIQSTVLLKNLTYRHHEKYRNFSPDRINVFKNDFKYVLAKYHYFLDSENLQYYQTDIIRTKQGLITSMLLRSVSKTFLKAYGHEENGHMMLSIEEIDFMMKQFKPLLEPMGLWTKKIETFARNMLLLSDLFQSRSNGNGSMDVDEAVEYISMVMVSVEIQTRMMQAYVDVCENQGTESEPSFTTSCYRPKFFDIMFNQAALGSHLPKLKAYIENASSDESYKFLRAVEGFARDFDDEAIPMAKRDIVLLVGALLNIESTFVRFDQVKENNVLDPKELDRAFYVYRKGIVSVAELDEDQEQYSKSIFLYMVDEMKMPTPSSLFIFHNNPLRGTINAKRLNIGTLLYYLVQE